MKRLILLSLGAFWAISVLAQGTGGTNACDLSISNVSVQIVGDPVSLSATQCKITFNIQFDLRYNDGSKFVYFNSFLTEDYTPYFPCPGTGAQNAPTSARLGTSVSQPGKSFLDIALDNSVGRGAVGIPVTIPILTTYSQDPTVVLTTPTNSPGMTVTKTYTGTGNVDRFTMSNVTVIVNKSCASDIVIRTDIWASNQNSSTAKAQCWICGLPITLNNPAISGRIRCVVPRTYDVTITTTSSVAQQINYKVYIDVNNNGNLETLGTNPDIEIYNSAVSDPQPILISSSSPYTKTQQTYVPYSSDPQYANKNLIVELNSPSLSNARLQLLTFDPAIECTPLPVIFKSFNATRTEQTVLLQWQTASEQDNKGFQVQRNRGDGWKDIAFIHSQADNGNSSTVLTYHYIDANAAKGISQYRLLQVDIDGKGKFSEIRSVRGAEQASKLMVYPNPSTNGTINVVFDNTHPKNVTISDMSGRMIKQYKNVSGQLVIENLAEGYFTLQVADLQTNATAVEKIIVKRQ